MIIYDDGMWWGSMMLMTVWECMTMVNMRLCDNDHLWLYMVMFHGYAIWIWYLARTYDDDLCWWYMMTTYDGHVILGYTMMTYGEDIWLWPMLRTCCDDRWLNWDYDTIRGDTMVICDGDLNQCPFNNGIWWYMTKVLREVILWEI